VISNLASLNFPQEIIATVSVCVGRLYSNLPYYMIGLSLAVYIIFRRGLAALLILGKRQCESLRSGMGGSSNSHAFFVSIYLPEN
jgi:hypothetical protein